MQYIAQKDADEVLIDEDIAQKDTDVGLIDEGIAQKDADEVLIVEDVAQRDADEVMIEVTRGDCPLSSPNGLYCFPTETQKLRKYDQLKWKNPSTYLGVSKS